MKDKTEEKISETLNLKKIISSLSLHNASIKDYNSEALVTLKKRETALLNLTEGEYEVSEKLSTMQKETHNLFASILIIAEATEVALSALDEQKKDWEIWYSDLDTATTNFGKIIETVSKIISSLRELGERIKKIETDIRDIHNISHLTSGVSRNAGIKAYHAGELGKGFEVIAKELSQLTKESLTITAKVPETIERFQAKTKEALNFITELTHNIEQVKHNTEGMKEKLQSSEGLFSKFKQSSSIINDAVEKQKKVRETLGREEENTAKLSVQSLIETGNISNLEQTQSSLSLLINRFVRNSSEIIGLLEHKDNDEVTDDFNNASINIEKLSEYILRVSTLTTQIKDTSYGARKHFEAQKENLSEIFNVIKTNSRIKQKIIEKTNFLVLILKTVSEHFIETNDLSKKILGIIRGMALLVERADSYFVSLEDEIIVVEEILNKLKTFSKKSNLLSLYASIESARVFNFKKDLDVIVNQIKELSRQSTQSLKMIEDSITRAKFSMKNVNTVMSDTSRKLKNTEDDFKPILKGFNELNNSTGRLNELVKEMLVTLKRQTELEEKLIKIQETLSEKIDGNILMNLEITEESEKTQTAITKLADEIIEFKKDLEPFLSTHLKRKRKVLRLSLSGDMMDIDPSKTTDATSNRVASVIFKGLVEQGMDANIIPAVAKTWKLSEDGLQWDFILRENIKFHSGDLLSAEDVKKTIKHLLSGPHSYMFDMIKGSENLIKGKKKDIEGIKVMAANHLRITLNHPYIPFLKNLGVSCGGISRKTENGLVGAGPYRLKEWIKGKKIVVEAFDAYFGKKPFCDEIQFIVCQDEQETIERFLDGDFDIIDIPSSARKETLLSRAASNTVNVKSFSIYDIYYIGINVKSPTPFKEKMVRQALNYAINRNDYIEKVAKERGTPAKGIFPPNFPTYNNELSGYDFNPEKAKKLLMNAGFPGGLPGEYLLNIRDSANALRSAKILKEHLREVGINIKLNPLSWEELLKSSHTGQALLFALGWSNDNGDPDTFLYPLFHSKNWGEPGNTTFYKNAKVDKLLDEAAALIDHYERQKLYQEVERIVVDEAPWIFLYHSKHNVATHPYVRSYSKSPITSERLEDVWLA